MVIKTLRKDRTDEHFDLFWDRIMQRKDKQEGVSDPELPRKRKTPSRFELGYRLNYYTAQTEKDYYRRIYFQVYDLAIESITERFDQPDLSEFTRSLNACHKR